jgi:kynureninase
VQAVEAGQTTNSSMVLLARYRVVTSLFIVLFETGSCGQDLYDASVIYSYSI